MFEKATGVDKDKQDNQDAQSDYQAAKVSLHSVMINTTVNLPEIYG